MIDRSAVGRKTEDGVSGKGLPERPREKVKSASGSMEEIQGLQQNSNLNLSCYTYKQERPHSLKERFTFNLQLRFDFPPCHWSLFSHRNTACNRLLPISSLLKKDIGDLKGRNWDLSWEPRQTSVISDRRHCISVKLGHHA